MIYRVRTTSVHCVKLSQSSGGQRRVFFFLRLANVSYATADTRLSFCSSPMQMSTASRVRQFSFHFRFQIRADDRRQVRTGKKEKDRYQLPCSSEQKRSDVRGELECEWKDIVLTSSSLLQ